MTRSVAIEFDYWPDKALFPNKAGNTLHWSQRSGLRKVAKEEAYYRAINQIKKPFEKAIIEIFVSAKDKRPRDLDGFLSACKPWIDGIVMAGILKDDNYFCVPEISIQFQGVSTEAVTIIITEVELV